LSQAIPVVDLFAGPGGLGEGFSSLGGAFKIKVSVEKSEDAHRTLRLRAFKRELERRNLPMTSYCDYLAGHCSEPYDDRSAEAWKAAEDEAMLAELSEPKSDQALEDKLQKEIEIGGSWVLVGGPPCQAYSLVGRSRNKGVKDYAPEKDARHFLYKEYLKVIQKYRPAVFVMENVKGLVSSTVNGRRIFNGILNDLAAPDDALDHPAQRYGYRIHSLSTPDAIFEKGDDADEFLKTYGGDAFLLRSEDFGIPQARHRVFLIGVREDLYSGALVPLQKSPIRRNVADVLSDLPPLRSRLSKGDSADYWKLAVRQQAKIILSEAKRAGKRDIVEAMLTQMERLANEALSIGGIRVPKSEPERENVPDPLKTWLEKEPMEFWLNHETRGHMPSDLGRYFFASTFADVHGRSPVGMRDFNLPSLAPNHKSWENGAFADRFRVQCWDSVSKTITSHISKDGHAFIHPDPWQCRSFTVREAARIQTFPDDYFFEGGRTAQLHQVGNAVPPLLARQIAEKVYDLLNGNGKRNVLEAFPGYDEYIDAVTF